MKNWNTQIGSSILQATAATDCVNISDVSAFKLQKKLKLKTRVNMHFLVRLQCIWPSDLT